MSDAIRIEKLDKSYGHVRALNGLDLTLRTGEILGLLGPNGAGKTTTIRIVLGLLKADGGTATLLGGDPVRDAVALHRRLAYVPGDVELWPSLTGGEAITALARLRGGLDKAKVAHWAERLDLDLTKKGRTYSKGNRQKVALVAALASEAELLILDEPTSGLDPLMEVVFQDAIAEARERGVSVLLSSHILAQVEKLADRVSIIRDGVNIETGTLDELRHLSRTTIVAHLGTPVRGLDAVDGVHSVATSGDEVTIEVDGHGVDGVMRALAPLGVRSIVAHPPTLEQLLLSHYETR